MNISPSSISGLGVLGLEDSDEDISSFNQGSNLPTTAFTVTACSFAASTVILAAPGVKGLSEVGEWTGGVQGSWVSLRRSLISGFESGVQGLWRAVNKEQLFLDLDYLLLWHWGCKELLYKGQLLQNQGYLFLLLTLQQVYEELLYKKQCLPH